MKKYYVNIFILFIFYFGFCLQVFAAEVLQISSPSILLIGDNNRTYTVKIACADIISGSEEIAINWLKKQLPRNTKVNLRPKGFDNGVLVASVIPFDSDIDITDKYVIDGLAQKKC